MRANPAVRQEDAETEAILMDLAPDYLHEADVSGGPPASMTPGDSAGGFLL
jgi:hypothetical protein